VNIGISTSTTATPADIASRVRPLARAELFRRAVMARQIDEAWKNFEFEQELAELYDIFDYEQSLLKQPNPSPHPTTVDNEQKRLKHLKRIKLCRIKAAAKNDKPGHDLEPYQTRKLSKRQPISPDRGAHVTRGQRLLLHTIKARLAEFRLSRQMAATA
jgi:hypothetical protein